MIYYSKILFWHMVNIFKFVKEGSYIVICEKEEFCGFAFLFVCFLILFRSLGSILHNPSQFSHRTNSVVPCDWWPPYWTRVQSASCLALLFPVPRHCPPKPFACPVLSEHLPLRGPDSVRNCLWSKDSYQRLILKKPLSLQNSPVQNSSVATFI